MARLQQPKRSGISKDEFDAAVVQTFGRKRSTKQLAADLAKAKEML